MHCALHAQLPELHLLNMGNVSAWLGWKRQDAGQARSYLGGPGRWITCMSGTCRVCKKGRGGWLCGCGRRLVFANLNGYHVVSKHTFQ